MNETDRIGGPTGSETFFGKYAAMAERFQSDTRRYLKEHLIDEYESVGQAVAYNTIQNVVDNLAPGKKAKIRLSYSSRDKSFRINISGYNGITDWPRYNSLHFEGAQGRTRRGEGAKVLVPISDSVRTETRLADGMYRQSLWREELIWRSDKDSEAPIFAHFPASKLEPGETLISAEKVYDEVLDRKAGLDLANLREMVKVIQLDWDPLLRAESLVEIEYEVDGQRVRVEPWPIPEVVDQEIAENVEVTDADGKHIGTIEKIAFFLSKTPLRDIPKPAIAVCTNYHCVTYLQVWGGPNSNRLFGYVTADFLAESETTHHMSFKSTRAWRRVREIIGVRAEEFMLRNAGAEKLADARTQRVLGQVGQQINQLIRERFPEWHPEGGFIERRTRRERWIRNAKTDKDRYSPEDFCALSFEVVNPRKGPTGKLGVNSKLVDPAASVVREQSWMVELASGESRAIRDVFQLPRVLPTGNYSGRVRVIDEGKQLLDDTRFGFTVGDEEEEPEESEARSRTPRRRRATKETRGDALREPRLMIIQAGDDGQIPESYYDRTEHRVYLNYIAPTYTLVKSTDLAFRYHIAKSTIEELSRLQMEKELALMSPDEHTTEGILALVLKVGLAKATFLSEWATAEEGREKEKLGVVAR